MIAEYYRYSQCTCQATVCYCDYGEQPNIITFQFRRVEAKTLNKQWELKRDEETKEQIRILSKTYSSKYINPEMTNYTHLKYQSRLLGNPKPRRKEPTLAYKG
jgi:hypothetical protein